MKTRKLIVLKKMSLSKCGQVKFDGRYSRLYPRTSKRKSKAVGKLMNGVAFKVTMISL